jgi:polysaccharide biosynthesis PFTS motif protein
LEDIIFYQYASRAEKGALPKNVIFTIQNCIYKPLWAYALEKSNVSIEVVFFGVNDSFYLLKDGTYVGPSNEYTDMTWKRYHVVNNMQRDRLEKTLSLNPLFRKNNVSITVENNAIPLYDSRVDLSFLDKTRNIVFFPVTPFFEPLVARIGYTDRLHTYEITESILSELISWAAKNNYTVVLKDKNYNDDKVNRKYKKLVESLVKRNSINYISFSNMSPKRLIEKCDAVICQPFTSPAIFAQSQKKPVCYADPSSLLLKDQQASSGIEIVQGQGSLSQWLSNQLISND